MPGLVVQAVTTAGKRTFEENTDSSEAPFRVGYTARRRVGGATQRNRAKRRLREAVARVMPGHAKPGYDYVVIARAATLHRAFDDLLKDLETALARLGAK